MRITLMLVAVAACFVAYWFVFGEDPGIRALDSDTGSRMAATSQEPGLIEPFAAQQDGHSGSRTEIEDASAQGYLLDHTGIPVAGLAFGLETKDGRTPAGVTADDGSWSLGKELAGSSMDDGEIVCYFKVTSAVEMVVRVSIANEPLRISLPEFSDAQISLHDHRAGEVWRLVFTPTEKTMELDRNRMILLATETAETDEGRFRFRSLVGATYRLDVRGAGFEVEEPRRSIRIPAAIWLQKSQLHPRVVVRIVDAQGHLEQMSGTGLLRFEGHDDNRGDVYVKLENGIVDLGAWRRLAWNRDYSVFVLTSDGESFDRAFKTAEQPTTEVQELRLRRGQGLKRVKISGLYDKKPTSVVFEQASGQWLGISPVEGSDGVGRSYSLRASGEADVTGMPQGWRRIHFYYRDGEVAACSNVGRGTTTARRLRTVELVDEDLIARCKELRIRGPLIPSYEIVLPGMVQDREYWMRVDSFRMDAPADPKTKKVVWSKKLPLGMKSRFRYHVIGQPRSSDRLVYPQRK